MLYNLNKLPIVFFYNMILLSSEVEMDFFREHKKTIVGVIATAFVLWTFGMGLLLIIPNIGG